MKKLFSLIVVAVCSTQMDAEPAPRLPSESELREAAARAPVERISLPLSPGNPALPEVLAHSFFSLPVAKERELVTENWRREWHIYAEALVRTAKAEGMDFSGLDLCLKSLHEGRTNETMLVPAYTTPLVSPGASKQQADAMRDKASNELRGAMLERAEHPEKYENKYLAVVPVAAFLAKIKERDCWILVCKYAYDTHDERELLGGVMIWALDSQSAAITAFTSSD